MNQLHEFIDVNLVSYSYDMEDNKIEFELLDMDEGNRVALFSIHNILEMKCIIGYMYDGLLPAYMGKVVVTQHFKAKDLGSVTNYENISGPFFYIHLEGPAEIEILCLDCMVNL